MFLFYAIIFIVIPGFIDWCLIQDCPHIWVPLAVLPICLIILGYSEYKSSKGKNDIPKKPIDSRGSSSSAHANKSSSADTSNFSSDFKYGKKAENIPADIPQNQNSASKPQKSAKTTAKSSALDDTFDCYDLNLDDFDPNLGKAPNEQ